MKLLSVLFLSIFLSNSCYAECWFRHDSNRVAVPVVYNVSPVQYVVQYQPVVVTQPVYVPIAIQQTIEYKPVMTYYVPNNYYYGNSNPMHFYHNPWVYYRY
jgi:hypothetical protein